MHTPIGILLINIGSPTAPEEGPVREYLYEFLSDPYVIDYPKWLWRPHLKNVILRARPARSAKLYEKIWLEDGSPLIVLSQSIADKINQREADFRAVIGMRYSPPSIASALTLLKNENIKHLVVLPMFPQYSITTTKTALEYVKEFIPSQFQFEKVTTIEDYHEHPAYIQALANSIREQWQASGKPEKTIFSFHGIPARYVRRKKDPYLTQNQRTAELLAEKLELEDSEYLMTFQSRFGPEDWLQPYTDETLTQLGEAGCQSVHITCPGFAVDCLETLEEIAMENKEIYEQAGGKNYTFIPSLNDREDHIDALIEIIKDHL